MWPVCLGRPAHRCGLRMASRCSSSTDALQRGREASCVCRLRPERNNASIGRPLPIWVIGSSRCLLMGKLWPSFGVLRPEWVIYIRSG
jgi:hypothetical protein